MFKTHNLLGGSNRCQFLSNARIVVKKKLNTTAEVSLPVDTMKSVSIVSSGMQITASSRTIFSDVMHSNVLEPSNTKTKQ